MADSVYKSWDEQIDELTSGDFKEGVLKAIRQLKDEIYNLKVDNFNQSMGKLIRDDKRIVLSAPEIIIGDVNLGGVLNPDAQSSVIIKGNDVSMQGAGNLGKIDMRAPIIEQIAENPGIDGNEHIIGDVSSLISQAANITIQSDRVQKDGAFPAVNSITEGGIRINSDSQVDLTATKSLESLKSRIEEQIQTLKGSKEQIDAKVKAAQEEFKTQRQEIDELLEKKSKLGDGDDCIRTDYLDMDSLNDEIEDLSKALSESIYKYSNLLSMQGETMRLIKYFQARKEEIAKTSDDEFKKNPTFSSVNIVSETVNLSAMDGDGNVRTNPEAGINILTNTMNIMGDHDEKGSLLEGNSLKVNMKNVDITTSGATNMEADDKDVLTKAQYQNEGDVIIRSKNITLESVDYEIAEKKYKEKGLTADGKILLRSKTIEASTVNAKDVDVDDKGKLTKATYTSEGDVIINSKTVSVKAVDTQLDGGETKETALTKDSSFSVRAEKNSFSATDTEGKATGSMSINAKAIDVKSMDVEKEKRTDSKLAEGGVIKTVAEKMYVGAFSKDLKSKKLQAQSEEIGLFADKTLEAQQGEAKAVVQLSDGKAAVSGSETNLYGKTTINADTEIKCSLKVPKATVDNLEAKSSFNSPNISDGMGAGASGSGGNLSAKLKTEDAPKA
jgi:hypothetical protein